MHSAAFPRIHYPELHTAPEPPRPTPPVLAQVTPGEVARAEDFEHPEDRIADMRLMEKTTSLMDKVVLLPATQSQNAHHFSKKYIIGLKIDQTLPILRYSDTDFNAHWRQLQ